MCELSAEAMYQPCTLVELSKDRLVRDPRLKYGASLTTLKYEMPTALYVELLKHHVDKCKWVRYVYRVLRGGSRAPHCDVCIQNSIRRRPDNARRWGYSARGPYHRDEKPKKFWCRGCGKTIAGRTEHENSLTQRGIQPKIYEHCECLPVKLYHQVMNYTFTREKTSTSSEKSTE